MAKVLDELQTVPEPHRNQLIDRLRNFPVDEIVRKNADVSPRIFARPSGVTGISPMPDGHSRRSIDALEQALPALLPEGICERHAWLFVQWVELEGFRDDYEQMEDEVARLRAEALPRLLVGWI